MIKTLIKNGRIIDPANQIDTFGSVYIADNIIIGVDRAPADFSSDIILDAQDCIVCPGFIDLSARLREPGHSYKGTIASETKAAAHAGITTLCLPPDTQPVIDTQAVAELIHEKAANAHFPQVLPIGALTQGLKGLELSSMYALKQAGCIAVSNAHSAMANLLIFRRAMEYARSHDLLIMFQPNEPSLSNQGCMHEGTVSLRYGIPSIPEASETIAVAQCLELAELTGCKIHFSQLSCKKSVLKIEHAKQRGLNITADVAIHQLHLSENDIEAFNSVYHVLPPFRSEEDKEFLIHALETGYIDAICSNHQPHDLDAKLGAFPETEAGISALETLLPLTLKLVKNRQMTLNQAISKLTDIPAKILGLKSGGNLNIGSAADICIFNPDLNWQVNQENWQSRGLNTPYWGTQFTGKVKYTLQAGQVIFPDKNYGSI